jgi:hypothetical protein
MVYLIGIIGFIIGFFVGQMLLIYILRDSNLSNKDLMEDAALRWKYGSLNWFVSVAFAAGFVWMYKQYIL